MRLFSRGVEGAAPYKIVQNSDIVSHRLQTVSTAPKIERSVNSAQERIGTAKISNFTYQTKKAPTDFLSSVRAFYKYRILKIPNPAAQIDHHISFKSLTRYPARNKNNYSRNNEYPPRYPV